MSYIHDDFLLESEWARRLYHTYAKPQPILDFHCHLPAADIAADRRFRNLFEIWLEGDHYKWRAMRANGVGEEFCTGGADPRSKFLAWARTVPRTLRNPLYQWSHLELKRYFGFDGLLDGSTAAAVWELARERLADPALSARGILRRFAVRALCTTDDPTDDLEPHRALAAAAPETRVYPAFRPDRALEVDRPERFNAWLARLERAADREVRSHRDLLDALERRHARFHALGCRLSDHGLARAPAACPPDSVAAAIFAAARAGAPATAAERAQFAGSLLLHCGRLAAARGWTQQLHLGALRDASSRGLRAAGPDAGFDAIGDWPQAEALGRYLDRLDREDALPRTIVYNSNPSDNYACATLLGCFQDGRIPGKLQFGSGWWHLDHKEGMEWQLNCLSRTGLLARFAGMVTDSRSFMSYPRHEYFRRVLCNLLGGDLQRGELPADEALVGDLVQRVCFANAREHLRLEGL